jgi:glycosyltransferase involved in cell wall biosynthesis
MRLTVVFDRLGPYHVARLAALSDRADVTVIEVAGESGEYKWGKAETSTAIRRITLFPHTDSRNVRRSELFKVMGRSLDAARPDVVAVPGWADRGALAGLIWATKRSVPAVVMSASTTIDAPRHPLKEAIKRRVLSLAGAALVGGTRSKAYAAQLGIPAERIFPGYDVVDNEHFAEGADRARRDAAKLKAALNIPDRYFLACSRFVEKKNLFGLVNAYSIYRKGSGKTAWKLVLAGDGDLKPGLIEAARRLDIAEDVVFPGFLGYDVLPAYYGLAGAFMLTSTVEQWGLVVNEAMAVGLPVIVSNRCGCSPDLVEEGRNGFTFDPEDVGQIADLMTKISEDCDLAAMGEESRTIIDRWTPSVFAENMIAAAQTALDVGGRRPSVSNLLLLHSLVRL